MTFKEVLAQVLDWLQHDQCLSYGPNLAKGDFLAKYRRSTVQSVEK